MEGLISFLVYLGIMTGIYAILSLSLNFQYGFTGLANFGQVAFFMLGAYCSTILTLTFGLPFLVGLFGAMIIAGLFGFLIALPTANLKGDYWAIATLAAAEIVRRFFLNEEWVVGGGYYRGGAYGIGGIPRPLESLFTPYTYPLFYLGLVIIFVAFTYFVLRKLTTSPFGRVLKTIREADGLADALGKDTGKFRIKATAVGGGFAGIAGSLFAHYIGFIDPYTFMPIETFVVWAMIVVGGVGNNRGALVGAIAIQAFYSSTRFLKDYIPIGADTLASLRMVVIGVLIVVVILFMREGLVKEKKRVYELEAEGESQC